MTGKKRLLGERAFRPPSLIPKLSSNDPWALNRGGKKILKGKENIHMNY